MSVHQNHNQLIATRIHEEVTKLLSAGAKDLDIFTGMTDQMDDFKTLLDFALPGEMDMLCARYEGFYRYAKILEEVAQGIEAGEIHIP
ncbi:MAG: arylsulfatase regulator [Gammaproteobacteria bacterium]|nr:arylsulfatase regulator [Gammaproteobacteria bacterium]